MAKASRGQAKSKRSASNSPAERTGPGPDAPVDWGLDEPLRVRAMFSRAGWLLALAAVVYLVNRAEYPGPAARLAGVVALIGLAFLAAGRYLIWSSRVAKLRVRDQLLDAAGLSGEERVLDVGCGPGLLAIGAAKQLQTGRATGIDQWDPRRVKGNSQELARSNAKAEGAADKVKFETWDGSRLVYPDDHFDVVLSSLYLHAFPDAGHRAATVREMFRVLKPGGKLLIHDIFYASEHPETLREAGAASVEMGPAAWWWCGLSRTVSATK